MFPTLFISGKSGTGKTTLIKKIIENLSELGLTIAVLKHSSSDIEGETKGKDTCQYRNSGAVATAVVGKNLTAVFHHNHITGDPVALAQRLFNKQSSIDLILIEGYKSLQYPKIALPVTKEDASDFAGAIAYVLPEVDMNSSTLNEKPLFKRDSIKEISTFIHNWWQVETCKENSFCRVTLSDGNELIVNEYTAITLNKMIRGLLAELRGYEERFPFTLQCSNGKVEIYGEQKRISVKPFVSEMIELSVRGFLSSLKDTEGLLSNFKIELPPVL